MDEILPGLLHYAAFHEGIRQTVHSAYHVPSGLLIDPMPPPGELPAAPRRVALTNRHHLRAAASFGVPIHCHEAGLHEFAGGGPEVEGFAWGAELAPGVRAVEVGGLCDEETALHIDAGPGVLAFADAVIGGPDGELAFVPDDLMGEDPAAVKRALRAALKRILAEQEFDALLLAHGDPVPRGGRAALRSFLARENGA